MSEINLKLISLIRSDSNPSEAIEIAISVISDFLKRPQSSQEASPVDLRELP